MMCSGTQAEALSDFAAYRSKAAVEITASA
jgi:hypothetical protein